MSIENVEHHFGVNLESVRFWRGKHLSLWGFWVQSKWKNENAIQFLSHTVDPKTDTPNKLKRYAKFFDVDTKNWNFVTGKKTELYELGFHSYMVTTDEDDIAPGGFIHSSLFILVDKKLHIRGIYDGLKIEELNQLNIDLKLLLNEWKKI